MHRSHLISSYPELADLIDQVGLIPQLQADEVPVAEAITRIVVGQMLSRSAARSIYARVEAMRDAAGAEGSWRLSASQLASAGLSRRKVRTIKEFGERYDKRPLHFEQWRNMKFEDLALEVENCWGLSHWSASILALFYFADADVFPASDGSIRRVTALLQSKQIIGQDFDSEAARPYRSYLALYLWAILDRGIVSE